MSVIKRYMVTRNGKGIGFEDSEEEAFELIKRDLNVKKDFQYQIEDLDNKTYVPAGAYVSDLKKQARLAKQKKKPTKRKVKRNDVIDDEYSKWLGKQSCVVTGQRAVRGAGHYNMHCHHIHGRNGRRNDYMQVPLMGHVHSWGGTSYHSCAKSDFIKHHNLTVNDVVEYFEEHAKRLREDYERLMKKKPTKLGEVLGKDDLLVEFEREE